MKVIVTGSGGFIGREVVLQLERWGHQAIEYDRATGDDVLDLRALAHRGRGCDAIIHLAGVLGTHELFDSPYRAVDINVRGTLNVLEVCRDHRLRYVGITMPQVFPSIYTATKVCATRLASAYHHSHGVPVSHVRAFNAFGPGQAHGDGHPQKIIPTFAVNAWIGQPLPIWGDGSQTVDLIHTRDLAQMLVDALRFGNDEVFDGGTGYALSVMRVADEILEYVASKLKCPIPSDSIQRLPMRRGEIPTNIVAQGEGWDKLGWKPLFNWYELFDTVDSYRPEATARIITKIMQP